MIELKQIEIAYQAQFLLSADSLALKAGELVALIGRNGSGKSSLIKGIAGLNRDLKGEINYQNSALNKRSTIELAKTLAVVHTDAPFPAIMRMEEFVAFGRYPFNNWLGKLRKADLEAVNNAITACELDYLRGMSMDKLSDGEKQRAMIARAISQESKFLILDEPSTHLDGQNTLKILKLLKAQAKEKGRGVLFSTHRIAESIELADQLWIISDKKLRSYSKEDFLANAKLQKDLFGEHINFKAGEDGSHFSINLS